MTHMRTPVSVIILLVGLAANMAPGGHCWCWYLAHSFGQDPGSASATSSEAAESGCCRPNSGETKDSKSGSPNDGQGPCCCAQQGKVFDVAQATTAAQQNFDCALSAEGPAAVPAPAFQSRAPQTGLDTRPPPGRALYLLHDVFLL